MDEEVWMNNLSNARRTFAIFLFVAITATGWLMMHEGLSGVSHASHHDVAFNPAYQHCQRLEVAVARAAMDVLGIAGTDRTDQHESYQADYRLQRMQIQADSEGLARWAAHDPQRQGLLLEVHASLASLRIALDQASGSSTPSNPSTQAASAGRIPLLPAVNRTQSALSNYAASLTQPAHLQRTQYLFAGPVLLWWLLVLMLLEITALAWLVFSSQNDAKRNALPQ